MELNIDSQVIGNNLQRNGFSGGIAGSSLFSSIAHVLSFFTLVNRVAYGLARLGFDVDGGLIIYDHVPEVIKPLIAIDCLSFYSSFRPLVISLWVLALFYFRKKSITTP